MDIRVLNYTQFPNLSYSGMDSDNNIFSVILIKTTFDVKNDGNIYISDEQDPFIFTDNFVREINQSSLKYPSDFVPFKPKLDFLFNCVSQAPDKSAAKSWISKIKVIAGNEIILEKKIRVFGPRWWLPKWKRNLTEQEKKNWKNYRNLFLGWELSEPEPISSLPLLYEYAYGGCIHKESGENGNSIIEAYEYNPVGIGFIDHEWTDHTKRHPAPQIEDMNDPINDPYKRYKPVGFGPIPSVWLPRRPLGGTYDEDWLNNIWPNWPKDYDFRFNNSAPEDQQLEFIDSNFKILFENINNNLSLNFNNPIPYISYTTGDKEEWEHQRFLLDTVYFNLDKIDQNERRVFCNWKVFLPDNTDINEVHIYTAQDNFKEHLSAFKNLFPITKLPNSN